MDMNTEEVDEADEIASEADEIASEAEGFADAKELGSVVQHHEGKQVLFSSSFHCS